MRTRIYTCALAVLLTIVFADTAFTQTGDRPGGQAATQPPAREALTGARWMLVKIMSMDDSEYVPEEPSSYTLRLLDDGSVQVRAHCNRGTGSWTSSAPGKLEFGQIAATRALCPPGSLHDRYMAQFPWVRSYVVENGHLFLATMADGSIIEFEPQPLPLAATVLGEEVRTDDPAEMQRIVLTRLFDAYTEAQGIEVTDAEIDDYLATLDAGLREEGLTEGAELTLEEQAQVTEMRRGMGRSMIRQWKLNRALYRQYGGRIIYQQLGPEPLDAYRRYLEERRDAGDFTIREKAFEESFWKYFTDDSMHSFYPAGSEEEADAFRVPFWQR